MPNFIEVIYRLSSSILESQIGDIQDSALQNQVNTLCQSIQEARNYEKERR